MFVIENWMFQLCLTYSQLVVFSYVYNCIKSNAWNPKEISSVVLADIMLKQQPNISAILNDLCRLGLVVHSDNTTSRCCVYSLTPKVFEVSKETPVTQQLTSVDYSEQIEQIMGAFHSVLGFDNYPRELIEQWSIPLLSKGRTSDELCDVVIFKGKEWRNNFSMKFNIKPQTLFNPEYFEKYLYEVNIQKFDAASNNIDIRLVYRLYKHLELNPPEKLTEWCITTLRENPDMNVNSLVVAIHRMYFELKDSNNREWLQNKLGSTNKLTELLPKHKALAIELQDMADDIPHLVI